VFSSGFIEHFPDVPSVVERICALARGYVVTIVPNVEGINGLISKTLRPEVYREHVRIDRTALNAFHTHCGLQTLFCDYVGGAALIMPASQNGFFRRHRHCARAVNAPARALNALSAGLSRMLACTPRSRLVCSALMYIGEVRG
jgi:hypothetical protein